MERQFSSILGGALAVLALDGFAKRDYPKHFLGLMNVDTPHSVLRAPLTAILFYGGSRQSSLKTTRSILSFVGMFYIAMGAAGSMDKSVGHMLPSKLTKFDLIYHFAVGAAALWLGKRSGRMMKP